MVSWNVLQRRDDITDDGAAGRTLTRRPLPVVACIDDDTLIREGVSRLLPIEVAFTTDRIEPFLAARPRVDVVLFDLWLHGGADPDQPVEQPHGVQGARGVGELATAGYRTLIYTNERRREVLALCLARGARGIVHKSEPLEAVVDAIGRVADGEVLITTALAGLAEVVDRLGGMPTLSWRQRDVLRGRARGEMYKSIAARLYISPKTAEEYMGEVTKRFAAYLREHSAADLERRLGIAPGDLLDEK